MEMSATEISCHVLDPNLEGFIISEKLISSNTEESTLIKRAHDRCIVNHI